jgi:predicted enzyme related to lactoylglutathione lyase
MGPHPFVHIEFAAADLEEAAGFYSQAFGWKTQSMPGMKYVTIEAGPGPGGGFNPVDDKDYHPGVIVPYIQTADIESSLAKIESLGGTVVRPKTDITGMGWFGLFRDPTGNLVGLFTAGQA